MEKMHPLMAASRHRLVTPTQTGIGEREHLANPSIDLEMHIQDILTSSDMKTCGHRTDRPQLMAAWSQPAVADRARDPLPSYYLDAFVPDDDSLIWI